MPICSTNCKKIIHDIDEKFNDHLKISQYTIGKPEFIDDFLEILHLCAKNGLKDTVL